MAKPVPWQDFETWEAFGLLNGFDKRNPESLRKSKKKKERQWFFKGRKKDWTKTFQFTLKIITAKTLLRSKKEWKQYGLQQEYHTRNPNYFRTSEKPEERSWYSKGRLEGWLPTFKFTRKCPFQNHEKVPW